jgi:AraC-like DNA-binding protein
MAAESHGHGPVRLRAWRPAVPGVSEVLHARFTDHAYPRHVHDAWAVLIVDEGVIRYDLDLHEHDTDSTDVTVLPPHVVHDGRAATGLGFRKRVLYLEPSVLPVALIGRAVDGPTLRDRGLRQAIDGLHRRLRDADDALEAESRLALVAERLRFGLAARPEPEPLPHSLVADRLRELLDARITEPVTLEWAATVLGVSPAHLVRSFGKAFGLPPHRYVVGRRLDLARGRLLAGEPVAEVATGVGFYDQAHLTRHFGRLLPTTPARFARSA